MSKSFFNTNNFFCYTQDAIDCSNDIHKALKPIFDEWSTQGFSPREIASIIHSDALSLECEYIMKLRADDYNRKDGNKGIK